MAQYYLLQNKEHDEEVPIRSNLSTRIVNPKLRKWISALACFLCGCVFTIMNLLTSHHALSNETAFAGDLSFLSTFLARVPAIQIVADWNPRYSSPWHRLQKLYSRREVQARTLVRE